MYTISNCYAGNHHGIVEKTPLVSLGNISRTLNLTVNFFFHSKPTHR
jgi:hypothetical protein